MSTCYSLYQTTTVVHHISAHVNIFNGIKLKSQMWNLKENFERKVELVNFRRCYLSVKLFNEHKLQTVTSSPSVYWVTPFFFLLAHEARLDTGNRPIMQTYCCACSVECLPKEPSKSKLILNASLSRAYIHGRYEQTASEWKRKKENRIKKITNRN